ncbi:MAG: molybdopterin-binding protein, partial [Eubacteriales bacterium]|nr:molybdopterin-binding protein [Eubacteriales bacterium]
MELNLFEKTELWINRINLQNVNLNDIAGAAAEILSLPKDNVLVVDVRETHITLDILQQQIQAETIYGKKKALLRRLSQIPGVSIFEDTEVHSEEILGMIALEESEASGVLESGRRIAEEIRHRVSKRAIVFPTGFEVKNGMIEDTNTPFIIQKLKEKGYQVKAGEAIDDDLLLIAGKIRAAVQNGYGLVITTGGVGAED